MRHLLFLLFPALLCPSLAAQSKTKALKPGTKKSAPAPSVIWPSVLLGSTAYSDQVDSDLEITLKDDVLLDEVNEVDPRPTRVAWSLRAESEPAAKALFIFLYANPVLENLGLVRISDSDYQQYRRSYRNFPDLAFQSRQATIYRPKDAERFRALLNKVKLLGNRQLGSFNASIGQLFVLVEPRDFSFSKDEAHFSVRLSTLLYGGFGHQGQPPQAGPLDDSSRSSQTLIREVREGFLGTAKGGLATKPSPKEVSEKP